MPEYAGDCFGPCIFAIDGGYSLAQAAKLLIHIQHSSFIRPVYDLWRAITNRSRDRFGKNKNREYGFD